jgi:hypothetical protein
MSPLPLRRPHATRRRERLCNWLAMLALLVCGIVLPPMP